MAAVDNRWGEVIFLNLEENFATNPCVCKLPTVSEAGGQQISEPDFTTTVRHARRELAI